jgi:hypothetical protein
LVIISFAKVKQPLNFPLFLDNINIFKNLYLATYMKLLKGFGSDNSSQPDPDKTKTETELDTTLVETKTTNSKLDTTLVNTPTAAANGDRTKTDDIGTIKECGTKPASKWYSHIPVNARRWLLLIPVVVVLLQLAQCAFRREPVISDRQSSPQLSTSSANSAATTGGCATDLQSRMKQANISSKRIDRLFAEKHPDLRDRKLAAQDEALKKEWCQLAEQEISSR